MLLTARHLRRPPVAETVKTDLFKDLQRTSPPELGRYALDLHDKLHVFPRCQDRDEVVGLENETDLVQPHPCQRGFAEIVDAVIAEPDFTTVWGVEPADGVEQRGLAAARRRGQTHKPAFGNFEVHMVEAGDLQVPLVVGFTKLDAAYVTHVYTFVMARIGSYRDARQAGDRLAKKPSTITMRFASTTSERYNAG